MTDMITLPRAEVLQVLEALEEVQEVMNTSELFNSRVDALQKRLAQPVQQGWKLVPVEPTPEMIRAAEFDRTYYGSVHANSYRAMLNAAPQPKQGQEPKFWYDEEDGLLHDRFCDAPHGCIPLYTAPQPRQWQGLTDKEVDECFSRDPRVAARNAEAKLREKNA